ncbi:biopolymer transporter ExbB [bacterium]|nr:MAG: biopolymer transporter ExbB [bacterium]
MRRFLLLTVILLGLAATAGAQDIRAAARQARADREQAEAAAQEVRESILADRTTLVARIDSLDVRRRFLVAEQVRLDRRAADLQTRIARLETSWQERELDFRETTGNVRLAARDVESLLEASPLSAGRPERVARVSRLLKKGYFPDLEDIVALATVLHDEIRRSGHVSVREQAFIGRDGERVTGRVFQLGKFSTLYALPDEEGFLSHNTGSHELYALPELPQRSLRRQLHKYLAGASEVAPVDLSSGAALRQLTAHSDFRDQLRAGGPLVWPILLIGLIALVIVVTKLVGLARVHADTDRLMGQVGKFAASQDWESCASFMTTEGKHTPALRVLKAGLGARHRVRESLESVLQEAILGELPRLQRGLAILAVMGAVAPLLGLLGTVTGMIETFRIITVHGTGDPKLMSGGISEALVTTELGLAVAIPIMLLHTIISRRVDHIIGDMEKQAVHLTNLLLDENGD